jgi:RNA polymerase sigma factor (sigma-70 family)
MPPPASGLPARLVLGPALRAQSDRRLVRLVREGYESAFEEIVRRYRRPLDRFAASIVGGRSEDVTQDSFRKALVALRDGEGELELRPWLYRIVRNTALNDLRDRPPAAAELAEDLVGGGRSAAAEAEQREEVAMLTTRMLALPAKQRAALVMRELEGMGHEEIAVALGVSGGAARQAIARGRATVRSGFGALLPLPLVRALAAGADGASEAAIGGAGAAAVGASGLGAGALKAGLATVLVAGSIGAGVAIDHHSGGRHRSDTPEAVATAPGGPRGDGLGSTPSLVLADVEHTGRSPESIRATSGRDRSHGGRHDRERGDDRSLGRGHRDDTGSGGRDGRETRNDDDSLVAGVGGAASDGSHRGGPGPSSQKGDDDRASSGHGGRSDDNSGHDSGSGSSGGGSDGSGNSHGGSGSGDGSQSSGTTRGGGGSDDAPAQVAGTAAAESSTSGGSGSSSGGSGSSGGGSGSSGGTGSSDGGSETVISDPSSSGSSGGPSSPSLDSTTDDASHSGGSPDSSETSEISP